MNSQSLKQFEDKEAEHEKHIAEIEAEIKEQKALFRKLDSEKRNESKIEKQVFSKFVESHEEKQDLKKANLRNEVASHTSTYINENKQSYFMLAEGDFSFRKVPVDNPRNLDQQSLEQI